ncbi:LuxR C-terminal-related transcriptional regulator [Streptomyces anulatus]|nr:LuxR C-terminal-related transcriptional regulator [Streptomyces anulatus]MCX4487894.1 LuxR C-terminal-related transcriptional regulator [Streptomyces anulatus]MCX4521914.1 LuxR C-terminal-related transcriptional regulator [Streptomyces anulatus]
MAREQAKKHGYGQASLILAMQRLYAEALRQGPSTRGELAGKVGLPHPVTSEAFERLVALELLEPGCAHSDVYNRRLLEVAEARTLAPLRRAVDDAERRLVTAAGEFAALRETQAAVEEAGHRENVAVEVHPHDIDPMLELAAEDCRTEVLTAQPGGPRPVHALSRAQERDTAMLERGVAMRTIYQHSARFNSSTEAYAARLGAAGAEIRTLEVLFPRLIIFDRRVAFIPAREPEALLIRHRDVVSYLVGVFELAWQAASPIESAYKSRRDGLVISDVQKAISRLLLIEEKDAAIARRLGISERSCRQHIAAIMAQLGARNRTHLGFLLADELYE